MAHASMPSAKTRLKIFFWKNEKTRRKQNKNEQENIKKKESKATPLVTQSSEGNYQYSGSLFNQRRPAGCAAQSKGHRVLRCDGGYLRVESCYH